MWNNQLMHCLGEHQHWSSFLATTVFLTNAVLAAVVRMMRVTGFWSRNPLHFRPPSSVFKEFHQVRCTGDHQHCPLEGSAVGLGCRTRYLESYQPGLASVLAAALMVDEPPSISDFVGAVGEDRQHVGALIKLMTTNRVEAVRTVQRLHRNLGHPSAASLVELLESRAASDEVMEAARTYHCVACERYRKPNQPSPALPPSTLTFNQEMEANMM